MSVVLPQNATVSADRSSHGYWTISFPDQNGVVWVSEPMSFNAPFAEVMRATRYLPIMVSRTRREPWWARVVSWLLTVGIIVRMVRE